MPLWMLFTPAGLSEPLYEEPKRVLSLSDHVVAVGPRAPAVVSAYAHLDGIDVDGDRIFLDDVPLRPRRLERGLRIGPGVEADGRVEGGDLDGLAVAVAELDPAAARAVALLARLDVVVGVEAEVGVVDAAIVVRNAADKPPGTITTKPSCLEPVSHKGSHHNKKSTHCNKDLAQPKTNKVML